jgi:hypothetical protein
LKFDFVKDLKYIYPMEGGAYYQIEKNKVNKIKSLLTAMFDNNYKKINAISKSLDKFKKIFTHQ